MTPIVISNKSDYQDFVDFINDPKVKIIETIKQKSGNLYKFNSDDEIFVPDQLVNDIKYSNDLIYGKDKTVNIVSIEPVDDLLYIYKEKDGKVDCEIRENKYWIVAPKMYPGFTKLSGNGYYRYIKYFDSRIAFEEERKIGYKRDYFSVYNPKESAMILNGMTYFKGMELKEVSTLFFDLESSGLLRNNSSKVFCISNVFRKNGKIIEKFFSVDDYDSDYEMIEDWCSWVREVNPSIMCGHNIFSFDLDYLNYCYSKVTGENLPLGRDGSGLVINSYTSKKRKDGSQEYEYYNMKIHGREIIDTMFVAFDYDIGRDFPSYALKSIIKHLNLEKKDRQHYDASKIAENWNNLKEREKIKAYAKDDAYDAMALFDLMIPPQFYLTQYIPKCFQQVINSATGSQINSFMIRAYIKDLHSLPKASEVTPYEGAISMGIPGIYSNVCKVDVASLYPSIMREYKVCNTYKDPKKYMVDMVEYFTIERLQNKKLANETDNKYYSDLEQSQKIVINSIYGFLGAKGLLFNSPKDAEFITAQGREILQKGIEWACGQRLEKVVKKVINKGKDTEKIKYHWVLGKKTSEGMGFKLVNVDTDSFSFSIDKPITKDLFKKLILDLNKLYPPLIRWEDDGVYDKLIVIKAKNYVLKKHKDWCKSKDLDEFGNVKIKYKGSSITDQKKEPILIEFIHEIIDELLGNNDYDKLISIYNKYCISAMNLTNINKWVTKKTVTKSVLEHQDTTQLKIWNSILDAMKNKVIEKVQEGDKIWVYEAIDGYIQKMEKGVPAFYKDGRPKLIENKILKFPELWKNDHNKKHYIKRVFDTINIFDSIINIDGFIDYTKKDNIKKLEMLINS